MNALIPLVVLIPLGCAALTLALPGRRRAQQAITVGALISMLAVSLVLMWSVDTDGPLVMQVGGWAAPYGISLVVNVVLLTMFRVRFVVLDVRPRSLSGAPVRGVGW